MFSGILARFFAHCYLFVSHPHPLLESSSFQKFSVGGSKWGRLKFCFRVCNSTVGWNQPAGGPWHWWLFSIDFVPVLWNSTMISANAQDLGSLQRHASPGRPGRVCSAAEVPVRDYVEVNRGKEAPSKWGVGACPSAWSCMKRRKLVDHFHCFLRDVTWPASCLRVLQSWPLCIPGDIACCCCCGFQLFVVPLHCQAFFLEHFTLC